jgi:hypothetical protein
MNNLGIWNSKVFHVQRNDPIPLFINISLSTLSDAPEYVYISMSKFKQGNISVNVFFESNNPTQPFVPLQLVNKRAGEWLTPVNDYYKHLFITSQSNLIIQFKPNHYEDL